MKKFLSEIFQLIKLLAIVIVYLAVLAALIVLTNDFFGEYVASAVMIAFLVLSVVLFIFLSHRSKLEKGHRGFKNVLQKIKVDTADGVKKVTHDITSLVKGLLYLAVILAIIGAIILAVILFGWVISGISATTIIIILLVLILLK